MKNSKTVSSDHPADRRADRRRSLARTTRSWRWLEAAAHAALSPTGRSAWAGGAAGFCALCLAHQFFALYGSGQVSLAALAAVTAVSVAIGLALSRISAPRFVMAIGSLIPIGWCVLFAPLNGLAASATQAVLGDPASMSAQYWAAFSAAAILLAVPEVCGSFLFASFAHTRTCSVLAGAAAALLIGSYFLAPLLGVMSLTYLACAITAGLTLLVYARPILAENLGRESNSRELPAQSQMRAIANAVWQAALSVGTGLVLAALARSTFQLFPLTEAGRWTQVAGFLGGAAAGCASLPLVSKRRRMLGWSLLVVGGVVLLPIILFAALTNLSLLATSNVSRVPLLTAIRGLAACWTVFPVGLAWIGMMSLNPLSGSGRTEDSAMRLLVGAVAVLSGTVASSYVLTHWWSVAAVVVVAGGIIALAGALLALSRVNTREQNLSVAGALAVVVFLAVSPRFFRLYDPARSARLLFSTNVFMASRDGMETRLLPFLNDGRLVAFAEGERGTYTLWRHHGVQLQVRESGVPRGAFCSHPEYCPQFSGECLPTVLPLVLHESPRHVLVLGLGSGASVPACLEFPVETLCCWEGDRQLIDLVNARIWSEASPDPRRDNRLQVVPVDPAWALHSPRGEYDVIVSDGQQACVEQGTAYFTREFYAAVARQLASDGIFSQRFQEIDFGPWPLQSVLATLRSVFVDVAAVEAGPGELVLLGTNSPRGLSRPGLLQRFQNPQVVRTLAQLGWDWSVALNLAAYSKDQCAAIAQDRAAINTASNGLFAFCLPQETMRWGNKGPELAALMQPHAGRIAQWANVESNDPDLLRRLSDVVTEHQLMTTSPDQPWAYRQALRDDLKKHPHSVISDTAQGFDRKLHPVDQRRLDYFVALGKATRAATLTPELLHRMDDFTEPYDPVLTYFVHHELAFLYQRAAVPDFASRLRHRLYTVYYSDTRDRSVRDVEDAIHLLVREGDSMEPADRFDHLNAMLEFLKVRWNNRGLAKPPSAQLLLNDLQRSIAASDAAFAKMEQLCQQIGIARADWLARREVLERSLVRPLRTYRSDLGPYYAKELEQTADAANKAATAQPNAN